MSPKASTGVMSGAWRIPALLAAAGVLAIAANVLYAPQLTLGATLSLVPATIMIVTLLAGWHTALLCAAASLAGLVLLPTAVQWEQLSVATGVAVLCGQALRKGLSPAITTVILMAALALGQQLFAAGARAPMVDITANAAAHAATNVVLATVVLVLMPRRSRFFPRRARTRWDHLLFVMLVGAVVATMLGVLAGGSAVPAQPGGSGLHSMAMRLCALILLALAASHPLAMGLAAATRRLPDAARAGSRVIRSTSPRIPLEVAAFLTRMRRGSSRLRHYAERSDRNLQQLRQAGMRTREELRRTQRSLQLQARALEEARLAGEDAEARYRALMEDSPEVALFVDCRGIIQSASRSTSAVLGLQPTELVGKPLASLIPPDWVLPHPLDVASREAPKLEGFTAEGPVRGAGKADRELIMQVQPFQVRGSCNHLIRLRESGRMKQALATLEETKELARSLDRSQDLFIATMSHELRTPLHGLIATLDMMRTDANSGEEFQHQLSIARSSARALLKIANDVLDLTRIKSSLFTLERVPFSMSRMLREVVDEASARAASLGLTLSLQIVGELPQSFIGDPGRLKQILANLVSNALKFTARGGATLKVRHDGRTCTVDVIDTGGGIPPNKREAIFDPFVQLESRVAQRIGGTGLGLPISRRLAKAMGGNLQVLDSGPQGSTFRLTVPLEASDETPLDEQSQRVFSNPRGRILVVEDNPANRYVAQALLAGLKCPATIVDGGREALAILRQQEFDLILMDCQMPGLDGYETTRRARALLQRRVPIIAMTANAMADDRSHCIDAGMDDYLPKPFSRQALNAILRKWLTPGVTSGATTGSLDARIGMHPDLDSDVLDELRESLQGRHKPLQQIRESFATSVQRVLPLLDNPDADRQLLQRQLHTLLGSAGMVGASQMEYLLGQIQRAVKDGRTQALEGATELLRRAMRRYEREFERWLDVGADTGGIESLVP